MIIKQKQQKIVFLILKNGAMSSSGVREKLMESGDEVSLVTIKRALSNMVSSGSLTILGSGPATTYEVSALGRLFIQIDAKGYCAVEPDKRFGLGRYNFDLLASVPTDVFSEDELKTLNTATKEYKTRINKASETIQKKELERLVIELAWKSSKIEGNTYTILDTEKLILENKEATGHDRKEAQMILNHKDAFNFVRENASGFRELSRTNLEKLHSIIVKDLTVGLGFRQKPVGVVGSKYRPLDNRYQISEAVEILAGAISKMKTPYAKALIALLGISYIQPFEDGNKRTSRLMANALLLAYDCAPLSYRSVDENSYREAMLVFYEVNSMMAFKDIFIEQYEFAAANYGAK